MLNDISQIKKQIFYDSTFEASETSKFIESENRREVTWGWEWAEGNGELLCNGCRLSVWGDEEFLEIDRGDGYKNILNIINATKL